MAVQGLVARSSTSLLQDSVLHCSTSVQQPIPGRLSSSPCLRSSFAGPKLRVHRLVADHYSLRPSSSLQIMAVTKKAVAVLKGTTSVGGTVTLIQEDDGKDH